MNIVYLHTHDIGRCVSPYGVSVETPNLQTFADSGATVFTNAHAVSPTCSPSRVGLLTGQYPHQQGMLGLAHLGYEMSHPERHLADWLKREHGYHTVLSGVQHEFDFGKPELMPYQDILDLDWSNGTAGRDRSAADQFVNWLEGYQDSAPFFASIGFYWPHVALPEVDQPAADSLIEPWPKNESTQLDTAALREAIQHTDACIGRVLDALQRSRFSEDTLVCITTDHGLPFPLNKATLYERGTGVMFMLRAPGRPGVPRSEALVSHLDFFPTVCELAELAPPEWLQGESLVPVLGGADTQREYLFTQTNHHVDYEPMRAVRSRTHRLIRHFQAGTRSEANVDASRLKTYVAENGFFVTPQQEVELYDLCEDPDERHNLAGEFALQVLKEEMEEELNRFMDETNDPLANSQRSECLTREGA